MKKIIAIFLTIVIIFSFTGIAYADSGVSRSQLFVSATEDGVIADQNVSWGSWHYLITLKGYFAFSRTTTSAIMQFLQSKVGRCVTYGNLISNIQSKTSSGQTLYYKIVYYERFASGGSMVQYYGIIYIYTNSSRTNCLGYAKGYPQSTIPGWTK